MRETKLLKMRYSIILQDKVITRKLYIFKRLTNLLLVVKIKCIWKLIGSIQLTSTFGQYY